MPGAAPVPGAGNQMTGNPNPVQVTVIAENVEPPQPQNTAAQTLSTQLANGNLPHNLQPTNVLQGAGPSNQGGNAGGDSLLAMMSRGQVIRGDSTYGQGTYVPGNGGAGPISVPAATVVAQPTGPASGVTYVANNPNLSGM
jgi:hypothetical protein